MPARKSHSHPCAPRFAAVEDAVAEAALPVVDDAVGLATVTDPDKDVASTDDVIAFRVVVAFACHTLMPCV